MPDINVWLALADRSHEHHLRAKEYWNDQSAARIAFCRITMLGLLRLGNNAKAMRGMPFTASEVWAAYRAFRALPEVTFIDEPADLEQQYEAWSHKPDFPASAWTDCYLAALAKSTGCRLVSLDRGFARFEGLSFLHLTA